MTRIRDLIHRSQIALHIVRMRRFPAVGGSIDRNFKNLYVNPELNYHQTAKRRPGPAEVTIREEVPLMRLT